MTPQTEKLLSEMQLRKTAGQKAAFRGWLLGELERAGYAPREESSPFGGHNVVAGDPERAKVLFTAHYDTQPILPFPNFITPRNMGIYLAFQALLCLGFFLVIAVTSALMAMAAAPLWAAMLASYAVCLFCLWWLFFGPANPHTANDNTSGTAVLLETALALPAADRDKVCFVFFDNEEKGMLGSAAFAKRRPAVKKEALVLNFDCVSDGDWLQFFPSKALKREEDVLRALEGAFQSKGPKGVEVVRARAFYPSDNLSFRRSLGVCALKKGRGVYYMDRIHTARDTVFHRENIELLRAGCLQLAQALGAHEEKEEKRYGDQS